MSYEDSSDSTTVFAPSDINSGFESESYGPPKNLGMCQEIHTEMTVYSNIWGRDLPQNYPMNTKLVLTLL